MTRSLQLIRPLTGRDPEEAHRSSTPLELLFDLTFVVAIAQVSSELHHGLLSGDFGATAFRYLFVFGAIWWAWMGFSWFASAFDTDDVFYRLLVFVQMTGALVLAAGVPRAFEQNDWRIVLLGYVILRLAYVLQLELVGILLGGLLTVFVMWWFYFYEPIYDLLTTRATVFAWGYGHLPIWAAAAAVGSGLAVAIEQAAGLETTLDAVAAGYTVTIPVAIFISGSWMLHGYARMRSWVDAAPVVLTVVALLVVPLSGWGVLLCGLVLSTLLAYKLGRRWISENAAMAVPIDD